MTAMKSWAAGGSCRGSAGVVFRFRLFAIFAHLLDQRTLWHQLQTSGDCVECGVPEISFSLQSGKQVPRSPTPSSMGPQSARFGMTGEEFQKPTLVWYPGAFFLVAVRKAGPSLAYPIFDGVPKRSLRDGR